MLLTKPILHEFQTGKINDASLIERIGMLVLRLSAWVTSPISYVGFSKAAQLVKIIAPSQKEVRTMLFDDCIFEYPYADRYWARLAYNGEVYTPDVEDFLLAMRDVDYAFIDCGANFGYMSVIITSKIYGKKPSIAIEADADTFRWLTHNAQLNENRFEVRHNAVFSKSGETVTIHGAKHEARSVLNATGETENGNIQTLALNDILPWVEKQKRQALILKLDVEGVEIDAMKGASDLLSKELLVLFEDHGSDKTHEISNYFLNDLGMRIFISEKEGCCEIKTLSKLNKIKRSSRVGYDFIATKSDFWLEKIQNYQYS